METRANYALIGVFTLAVIAAGFLFVYWFSGTNQNQRRDAVRVVFSGSVGGLAKGAGVQFNGIRVGEVTDVRLLPEDPRRVVAIAEVDRTVPLRVDTRARLEAALLTGVTTIGLVGGEPNAPPLSPRPGEPMPTIFADPGGMQDMMESVRNVARRADEVMERVNKLISDNEGAVNRTVQNVEAFSNALAGNAPGIERFLALVGDAATRIGPLAQKLEVLTDDVTTLVRSVDGQRVARALENVEGFTQTLSDNRENVSNALRDAATLAQRLNESAGRLDATLAEVGTLVRSVDAERINRTFANVEDFSRTLAENREQLGSAIRDVAALAKAVDAQKIDRTLANFEGFSQTLADNRENVTAMLRDAGALATRLNAMASKAEETLADIGEAVRAVDTGRLNATIANAEVFSKTLADNREALAAVIRDVGEIARSIDAGRINSTIANVEGFSQTLADNRENVTRMLADASALARRLQDSAAKLDTTLDDIGGLARAVDADKVNRAIDGAERFATTLGNASPEVEKAITEARALVEKLNKSADRVDGVLQAAEGFLGQGGGPEGQGMFQEIRDAARSIRTLADNLDKRTADITTGIVRFTGSGLKEVEALASDGRKTLNQIDRAVRNLERNPQQLIFGGKPSIPEYSGRR